MSEEMKYCQSYGMPLETKIVVGTNADLPIVEMIRYMKEIFNNDSIFSKAATIIKMNGFFPNLKR